MQTLQEATPVNMDRSDALREEDLPFTISVVRDEADLAKASRVRQQAYNRHMPELARLLAKPEDYDYDPGTAILLALSKLDGEPLGTMRIQSNRYAPLVLEDSVTLPGWLQGQSLSEATRLGVAHSEMGRLVKITLFKAYYLYCVQAGIKWMVITARAPMDQQYEALMFQDVFPEMGYIPMKHVGNIPHRVLAIEVATAEPNWREARHPLYDFVFQTHHADIKVDVTSLPDPESDIGRQAVVPQHL